MKYELMLFDMDGVMTGELCYWKAAAMTVWEYFYEESPSSMLTRTEEIFNTVFCHGETIQYTKQAGINTNHDLAYVVLALALANKDKEQPFLQVKELLKTKKQNAVEWYGHCEELLGKEWHHEGEKWHQIHGCFQDWYLGDGKEKPGFMKEEQPLFPPEQLAELLQKLNHAGIKCGMGTGRPYDEIVPHLKRWNIEQYFDSEHLITQTEVTVARETLEAQGISQSLSKPHFFIFGKGVAGRSSSDIDVLNREFDQDLVKKTLVVGDAGADIFAARDLGADFAAVLTGVNGQAERPFFEQEQATYIFDTVFGLEELI